MVLVIVVVLVEGNCGRRHTKKCGCGVFSAKTRGVGFALLVFTAWERGFNTSECLIDGPLAAGSGSIQLRAPIVAR
ncbi:hypothetical protein L484_020898 [Morus notabilis]|uniref:Secreted protein n=1 Tax=Morus notabilis TaxID=981085 RepID=W9QEC6_9ROSA|nr:hypothetical protein L484_020898 [Morus notabilis]